MSGTGREARGSAEDGTRLAELTTGDVLRLLGSGASGAILMALAGGPLRTKELAENVRGYTPRTVYRYARRLTELGVIERDEEPGVPSKVVYSLTEPQGRELLDLVDAYAGAALQRLPSGEIDAHAWRSMGLLAELWESGMIHELNRGPRSATELAQGRSDLSYHQVSRRAALFAIGGLIEESGGAGRRREYVLTTQTRRAMALIAGIGRWRRRHVVPAGETGLTQSEAAGLLRTVLPLVSVPEHAGKSLEMRIAPNRGRGQDELIRAAVGPDGGMVGWPAPQAEIHGSARAKVRDWIDSVLDRSHEGLDIEGDVPLIRTCLSTLHVALWQPAEL